MVCDQTTSGEVQRAALALLARREYSAAELKQKLVRKYQQRRYQQTRRMPSRGQRDIDRQGVECSTHESSASSEGTISSHETAMATEPTGATIDAVLAELLQAGLLSDRRYVENMVRNRVARGYGPIYIAQELRTKGAHESLIDEYLDHHSDVWLRHATDLARKKIRDSASRDTWLRTARYLQRRGFPADIVSKALGEPPPPERTA